MTKHYEFYISKATPCPYIQGKMERKVIVLPPSKWGNKTISQQFQQLQKNGFRRSQSAAYRPLCDKCRACQAVRIITTNFNLTRSMKRTWKKNNDLISTEVDNIATKEQFALFKKYITKRHKGDDMEQMNFQDFKDMINESPIDTKIIEFRKRNLNHKKEKLIAAVLFDRMEDHLSMVYSFFDPTENKRSLGTYIILHHIYKAQHEGKPHCHLGYWVEKSKQMNYKDKFLPQERFINNKWTLFT